MTNKEQNQLLFWIKAAFIGASLPFLLSHQSWAIDCTKPNVIQLKIEEFKDKDTKKVDAAINAVVNCGEKAIAPLRLALSEDEAVIRANAALTLGKMGTIAQDVAPVLVDTLEDREATVRTEALSALIQIGQAVEKKLDNDFKWWEFSTIEDIDAFEKSLEKAVGLLKEDKKQWVGKEQQIEKLRLLNKRISNKLKPFTNEIDYQVIQWIKKNPWIVALPAGYLIVNLGIFIFRPTLLLKIDESVRRWTFSLTGKLRIPLPLFLKYHSWVLDAWVKQRITTAREEFRERSTVEEREIHIFQPVFIEEKPVNGDQILEEIQKIFKQTLVRLVIYGEGGAGKTSLAYKLAEWAMWGRDQEDRNKRLCQHRMLPILIEEDLTDAESLKNRINRQLKDLTPETSNISEELIERLLAQQRILVIVDHLSELSNVTRNAIQSGISELPLNSLVITSRDENILGQEITTKFMQPRRISVGGLAGFLKKYLLNRGMKNEFDDFDDYSRAYNRLTQMVIVRQAGETEQGETEQNKQGLTILLVKLYAEQMIAAKETTSTEELPNNVPDLMLQYLNELNRNIQENRLENVKVHQISQIVAWKCIESTFKPESAEREQVLNALATDLESGVEEAQTRGEEYLNYLEKELKLVRRNQLHETTLRFTLDPLAEYLASLYLIEKYRYDEWEWESLVLQLAEEKPGCPEKIRGFLLALHECCEVKGKKIVPKNIIERLVRIADLDLEAIQAAQRKQRVRKLIEELDAPERKFRLRAVTDLATMGKEANIAVDQLLNVLQKHSEVVEIRLEALETLRQLKTGNGFSSILSNILEKHSEVGEIRLEAFKALKQLGVDNSPIPIVTIRVDAEINSFSLIQAPDTVKEVLGNGVTLDMVSIPVGNFMMGSPEGEGDDCEKPQHEVKVKPFFIGKYPVTQAQWRVIASLTKFKHDLNSDPSSFKGDDLPVEKVTWKEAVEFCKRLSKQTGQKYRLPTEAEWEYACRSGTTTPFHFGETITGDLANYNASQIYANEPKGEYRRKTIPVGSFPPNAFGLYDMHGNLWEWCEDDWHNSYEGAPTDSSAWISEISNEKVIRGGSWDVNPSVCRSAFRFNITRTKVYDNVGFRVVRVL